MKYYTSYRGAEAIGSAMGIRKVFLEEENPGLIINDKVRGECIQTKRTVFARGPARNNTSARASDTQKAISTTKSNFIKLSSGPERKGG